MRNRKRSLDKVESTEIIKSMFSNCNRMKLETRNQRQEKNLKNSQVCIN